MSRRVLPARRVMTVAEFMHKIEGSTQPLTASVSFYEDGSPAEIFIDPPKASNSMAQLVRDTGLLISIALQYGVPLDEMCLSVGRSDDGQPHSVMGSALDLVQRLSSKS